MITIYTILLYLIQPYIWFKLWLKGCKIPNYRKRWLERYGFCKGKVKSDGILLHAVSVGETLSSIPLVDALRNYYPLMPIVITTMTPTGSERVSSFFGKKIDHVYLPYDLPSAMNRFLNTIKPKLVIIMETELWPNMITLLHARKIPVIIVNARLSERSVKKYNKIRQLMKRIFKCITCIAAQSEEDGQRFLKLGLKPSHLSVTGSLKFDILIDPKIVSQGGKLRRQWAENRRVWIATSTHKGEELIILDAHRKLLTRFPNLLLILVPRHPERFSSVKTLTQKNNFNYILRSNGKMPTDKTQVIIGDTMGELMLLYGIADLAFIGGSLIKNVGGHNPLEAAAYSIPVLMGPYTFNFKDICLRLKQANGLITVTDADSLNEEISTLLTNEKSRVDYGCHAANVLYQNQGALKNILRLLNPYLSS